MTRTRTMADARTMADGRDALTAVIVWLAEQGEDNRNEAQTRLDIIDRLIVECFGWSREQKTKVRVEVFERGEFADYELGVPRCAIWEAKREGAAFALPPGSVRRPIQDLQSIVQRSTEVSAAVAQAQGYCASRGVELAVVTNGHQLICFLASRSDGVAPLDGYCFAVESLQRLDADFATAWDLLSPDGISEKRYIRLLKHGTERNIPPKLSSFLRHYPQHRYLSTTQATLRTLSELLLQDIGETEAEEEQFFDRCYCSSGALSQHALLNRQILEARYAALTDTAGLNSVTEAANPRRLGDGTIAPSVLQEALSRRPVILIGDVGVGKTSFLKHLIYKGAKDIFANALYIFINLGARGTLDSDIRDLVLNETERQLYERYHIDIRELAFLRGTYASEIERFRAGAFSDLFHSNIAKANERQADMLQSRTQDSYEHLRRSVSHLSKGRHHQVIFILDNADQRRDEVQQDAFLIAQEMAKEWVCHVFISLRPSTFYRSRMTGVLAAYPHRVFTISPPRMDDFLEKRLTYALDMAEGRLPVERLTGIKLNIASVGSVLRALLHSLERSDDLHEFLANITGGNVRELLQFVTSFIGTPNVDADKIVSIMKQRKGRYKIPLHEFSKAALLGDYSHYQSASSIAMNVFDTRIADPREHFLVLLVLAFLDFDGPHRDTSGFAPLDVIVSEMQRQGFTIDQVDDAVKRTTNKRLIETPHRAVFDDEPQTQFASLGEKYRLTARGAYHLRKWVPTFAYLDAMAFDTPIYNEAFREESMAELESFDIHVRYARAVAFRTYLHVRWQEASIGTSYFNFTELLQRGESTFVAVRQVVRPARKQ